MIKSTKLVQSSTFLKKSHRILAKKEIHMVHSRTGREHVPYIESSPMWTVDLIPAIQFGCCLHEGYLFVWVLLGNPFPKNVGAC